MAVTSCSRKESKVIGGKSCYATLKTIDGAKETWAFERAATNGTRVVEADLSALLGEFPRCPQGGTYTIGPVGTRAKCSHPDHQFVAY